MRNRRPRSSTPTPWTSGSSRAGTWGSRNASTTTSERRLTTASSGRSRRACRTTTSPTVCTGSRTCPSRVRRLPRMSRSPRTIGITTIRIGDPDVEISGRHTYTIGYRVEGALNGVPRSRRAVLERDRRRVAGADRARPCDGDGAGHDPAGDLLPGYPESTEPCARATSDGSEASFRPGRELSPFEGLTVVVAIPKGAVPEPVPILEERWAAERAFSVNGGTISGAVAVALLLGGLLGRVWWRGDATAATGAHRSTRCWGRRQGRASPSHWGRAMLRPRSSSRRPRTAAR